MRLEAGSAGPAARAPSDVSGERAHDAKVQRICDQLRARPPGQPVRLRKKAVSHQVPRPGRGAGDGQIDVGDLTEILDIDVTARTCVAESGVTFVDLVAATLRHGLVPIVVPELKTITVGGAVAGCSIESMSYRYGGFHDTCLEYEVVTAKGEVLTCGPGQGNELLFQMMQGTFGTLGILTKLTFRLVPAKPFVRVTYRKHRSVGDYQAAIARHFDAQDVDFMDGIIHGPEEWVLSTGLFVDEAPYTNRYDWMKVYHQSTRERQEDFLRTTDYLFRYDRGVTNVHPKSWVGRLFLGKLVDSSRLLRMAEWFERLLPAQAVPVTVDVFIPFSRVPTFLDWFEKRFHHYPLWCVPYKRVRDYEWLSPDFYRGLDDRLFLDLAIYGMEQRKGENAYKEIEEELIRVGGLKTLISSNFFSEEQFWKIWNKPNYDRVKALTDPDNAFHDLYTKTHRQ
jgi:FAD/FMN-containing dehydrogenase